MEDQILEGNTSKNIRHRKKLLYITLLQQMEFYFSDSNLSKNKFLNQLVKADPYVNLSEFLNFNKIRNLTNNVDDLCKALRKSEKLRLSEDNKKVCRITEIQVKTNVDECTIYVERLPADAEHDWLTNIFSVFGAVVYVSIPKYRHNKMIKGFAFVEFATPESATKALEYFESIDCKLPTKMPPEQLASIVTYENENVAQETIIDPIPEQVIDNNVEQIDTIKVESETNGKLDKRKCEHFELEPAAKIQKIDVKEHLDLDIASSEEVEENQIEENSEKRKRKRKKSKKKHQNDLKQIGLQVLSKKEWKQLRNKYLNLQKQKMQNLKEHLNRGRYTNYSEHSNRKSNLKKNEVEKAPRFKYTPGTIINFQLSEVCNDVKKFKADLRTQQGIEFIDLKIGDDVGYLRFSSSESTLKFSNASPLNAELRVLQGAEEENYWQKITKERAYKLKKDTGKNHRGRDKLLRKAEKELGKHIRFENAE